MLVGIHQPNFFPWLGYFDKIARTDCFVILDSVPLQLTGGNYTNRVKMIISGAPSWLTMPLRRGHAARSRIDHAEVIDDATWRRKMKRSIEQSYVKAPFFPSVMPIVEKVLDLKTVSLVELNITGIYALAEVLGISTSRILRSSELPVEGQSNELLANIVHAAGGDTYLAGHGASGYQDDDVFAAKGIAVRYQGYVPEAYPQLGVDEFIPGMSAIDALMNCGASAGKLVGSNRT